MKRDKKRRIAAKGRAVNPVIREELQQLLGKLVLQRDQLIECLHMIQDTHGHITDGHIVALADLMQLASTEVYEVATFYHHFDVVKDDHPKPPAMTVRVCDSVTCEMFGAEQLISELEASTDSNLRIQRVPCVGRCETAPVAVVGQNPVLNANQAKVISLVEKSDTKDPIPDTVNDLITYQSAGGYKLLRECYSGDKDKEDVISALEKAELRGLGGAGFPAGRKWRIVSGFDGPRLLAVNIDEGEPGTFKDRYYLERDPHRFIEGMLIACWAVGIDKSYVYVRDEYPACIEILREAIADAELILGKHMPEVEIRRGAGAYICGEESAMIESIEGKRGMPRLRPPFVAEVGLFGRPTLEHNMETLYWVRDIVEKGADWFTSYGRNDCKGLRSYSVSGRVKKPGVHLAPAGISLNELIEEYCGGMLDGHELYGYFPGGASGGILPASLADLPLDFDTLQPHGCFIGSAAIIVFSDQDKARDLALNAMKFFAHESCGKCTPCRVGTSKAAGLMEDSKWDKQKLDDLSEVMMDASICGLGQAAPNPMLCVFKYFNEEVA